MSWAWVGSKNRNSKQLLESFYYRDSLLYFSYSSIGCFFTCTWWCRKTCFDFIFSSGKSWPLESLSLISSTSSLLGTLPPTPVKFYCLSAVHISFKEPAIWHTLPTPWILFLQDPICHLNPPASSSSPWAALSTNSSRLRRLRYSPHQLKEHILTTAVKKRCHTSWKNRDPLVHRRSISPPKGQFPTWT